MSALPDDASGDDEWKDEWNDDDWHELSVADRGYRNEASWAEWGLKLLAIAVVLPMVLGILFLMLVLLF